MNSRLHDITAETLIPFPLLSAKRENPKKPFFSVSFVCLRAITFDHCVLTMVMSCGTNFVQNVCLSFFYH